MLRYFVGCRDMGRAPATTLLERVPPWSRYVLRRVATSAAMLLVLSFVIFAGIQKLVPGNEADILAGSLGATPKAVLAIEERLGLTRPLLVQYVGWLGNALHGNFGVSPISGLKISAVIAQQAPVSLELAVLGLAIATVIGVPVGVVAAINSGKGREVALRVPFLVIYALPFFVIGAGLLLVAARYFPVAYGGAYVPITSSPIGNLRVMVLPALSVGLPVTGLMMQMTRGSMLDVLSQPHIVTARANGLRLRRIYFIYALKAAALPILTLEGFMLGVLIGGVIVVEQVFSLPGIGSGMLNSIQNRDFTQLEAQMLVVAAVFVVGNLVVDLAAPVVDRRVH